MCMSRRARTHDNHVGILHVQLGVLLSFVKSLRAFRRAELFDLSFVIPEFLMYVLGVPAFL